jgi:hypothetical protein
MTLPPKPEYPDSPQALAAFIAKALKPNYPSTPDALATFITDQGPQAEQQRAFFEEVDAALVDLYARWPQHGAEYILDDLCNRITDPLLRAMARRTRGPMLGTGLITQQTVFYCIINARTWLHMAIVRDAFAPRTTPT